MSYKDFEVYNPSWGAVATALSYRMLFDNDPTSEQTLQKLYKEVLARSIYPFSVDETLAGLRYVSEHAEVDLSQLLPDSKPDATLRQVFANLAKSLTAFQAEQDCDAAH